MSTGYYLKTKKGFEKKACERHQNLSEEEKHKSVKMVAEDEKQRLVEYRKIKTELNKVE